MKLRRLHDKKLGDRIVADKFRDREWARKGECADCKMWRFCLGGGMHLHDDQEHLMYCHYKRLQ